MNGLEDGTTLALLVDKRDGRPEAVMEKGTQAPSETKMALVDGREAPSGKKEYILEVGVQAVEEDEQKPDKEEFETMSIFHSILH